MLKKAFILMLLPGMALAEDAILLKVLTFNI